jgi:hypothetical protein
MYAPHLPKLLFRLFSCYALHLLHTISIHPHLLHGRTVDQAVPWASASAEELSAEVAPPARVEQQA